MAVLVGLLTFIEIFVLSMLIGIIFGLITSLLFRGKVIDGENAPVEASIVVLLGLSSFFCSEALGQSGIVAILFCGMVTNLFTSKPPKTCGNTGSSSYLVHALDEFELSQWYGVDHGQVYKTKSF